MSIQPDIPESLDPLGTWRAARDASQEIWRVTRDASLETWSKLMIDLVNSEAYSQVTSQWLDTYLTVSQPFQRVLETTMTQVLTRLNMPIRTEMTSLAQRLTNVEMRLDDLDAKLDVILLALQTFAASNPVADTAPVAPIPPVKSAGAFPENSSGRTRGKPKQVR